MDQALLEQATKALDKAKIGLMMAPDSVFFSSLVFSLYHKFTDSLPTAATDGTQVLYNPNFWMTCSPEQRIGLLLHETFHVMFLHLVRRGSRDPNRWNRAGDYVINLLLNQRGFALPQGALLDKQYIDMSTEQVYDLLENDGSPAPMEDLIEGGTLSPEEQKAAENAVADILIRAAAASHQAGEKPGTIPGQFQILLDKLLNPVLPWQTILRRYISPLAKDDYTWTRPNRRFFPKHYLPSLRSPKVHRFMLAVDSSGSVSDQEFLRMASETYAILRMLKPEAIELVVFDYAVRSVTVLKRPGDIHTVEFTGRGGTSVDGVFTQLEHSKARLLVIFSDGEFHYDHLKDPGIPVIWMINGTATFTPPFGKVIRYHPEGGIT